MDPRRPNTGYARPNKSSKLRASANKFRDSNESLPSPSGISRTTYKLCGTEQCSESCSESVYRRMEEPGKLPSQIPQPKTNTLGAQRLTAATPELGRRKSRLRIVETQYQKLQGHQSEFLDALKSLGPQESQMLGTCQLVPLVLDADNKLVLQKDKDPISVPPNLSADRAKDVKARCQAAVDSGFGMLFDHVEPIRRARDELEACNQKEQLMVRLKDLLSRQMESISIGGESVAPVGQQDSPDSILYQELARLRSQQQRMEARLLHINKDHNERMNRLKANIGGRLKVGERNFQQTKHELSERLRSSEAQRIESARQLEVRKAPLTARDSSIASIRPYMEQLMSLNEDLQHQVQESDEALLRTRRELEGSREHKVCLEVQLGEVQAQILELQRRRDIMDLHDREKSNDELETKISELQEKLSSTAMQVDTREQRAEQLHSDLEHVRAELFGFEQLMVRLREQGIHDRILISSCTDEVNVLKQTSTASRETIEPLDLEGGTEEDTLSDLDSQLDSQQEQHQQLGHVCGQQGGLAEFTNNMSELNDCLLQIRDRQHEKNIQLDLEISRLRSPMFAPQQSSTLFDAFSFSLVLHFINK